MLSGIVEFLGWFGAVTVLAGYILFSTGKIPNGPVYQLFNLVGGLAVAVNVAAHHAVPSTIVNGIWAVVAVVVLVRMGRARRAAKRAGIDTLIELSAEPPVTTAVLPVIGPAVRHHEADAAVVADATPSLQADTAAPTSTAAPTDTAVPAAPTEPAAPAAPMTESIPVITAAIAIALVNAAQEQRRAERNERDDREQQEQHAS